MLWLNVLFVEKALISVTMSVILIENQIECGNLTLNQLDAKLTELRRGCMFVLPV